MSDKLTVGRIQELTAENNKLRAANEALEKELAGFKRWLDEESAFLSKDDLAATLVERAEKAEREVERLGSIVTECDGVECVKHDGLVRIAIEERKEADARKDRLRAALGWVLKEVQETIAAKRGYGTATIEDYFRDFVNIRLMLYAKDVKALQSALAPKEKESETNVKA